MSKIIYVMLLFIMSCGYHGHVRFDRMTIEDVSIRQVNKDSLILNYRVCFSPKSIGKKAFIVIVPRIIHLTDTSVFHCKAYNGERTKESCSIIVYKYLKCIDIEEQDSFAVSNDDYFEIIAGSVKDSSRMLYKIPVKDILNKK